MRQFLLPILLLLVGWNDVNDVCGDSTSQAAAKSKLDEATMKKDYGYQRWNQTNGNFEYMDVWYENTEDALFNKQGKLTEAQLKYCNDNMKIAFDNMLLAAQNLDVSDKELLKATSNVGTAKICYNQGQYDNSYNASVSSIQQSGIAVSKLNDADTQIYDVGKALGNVNMLLNMVP